MNVEDQYMDDLFGEADNVSHHIATAAPAVKGLAQRLDALASSNCCSKIAWSRFGCIASVAEHGRRLDLRLLIRSPKTGEWRLQKPAHIYPPLPDQHKLVHLAFSAMGNDLAAIDSAGRLMLYTTGFTLTSMMPVHTSANESWDEMNAIIGLHWLPVFPHTQKSAVFWSASRNGENGWNVRSQQHSAPGPYNPLDGKSALVVVTRKGTVRLLWQARNAPWSEISVDLGDTSTAVEYSFTHAALAPTKDSLLLAAHQVKGTLRLYEVRIEWNMPAKTEDQAQNAAATPSPTLDVKELVEENCFSPASLPSTGHEDAANGQVVDASYSFSLSRLLFVPPAPEGGTREQTVHTIIGVFATVPPLNNAMLMDTGMQWGQASSIVARWEVQTGLTDKMSSCFDSLSVKKKGTNGTSTRQKTRLKRVDDVSISPAVLAMQPVRNYTMYALTLSDGTVQFRYRGTMDVVLPDETPDEVQSLPQSGWSFPVLEPCLSTALSPGACVVASLKDEGEVKLEKIQYMNGDVVGVDESDSKHDALAALFALQYSSACTQYKVTDDILSVVPANLSASLARAFTNLSFRFLNIDFDVLSGDVQKQIFPLFRNHLAARCFSLQNALGSAERSGAKKLSSRIAWITLNLRHVSQNVCLNMSRPDQPLKADMAISIVGLVKWSLDLCVYLLQELLALHYHLKHEDASGKPGLASDLKYIQAYTLKHHSPALVLLLASMPRLFLRVAFRPLRYAYAHSQKGYATLSQAGQNLTNEQRMHQGAYGKLLGVYNSTPVNHTSLGPLEEFMGQIEELVKTGYSNSDIQQGPQRLAVERDMFVSGVIPDCLLGAVTEILTTKLDTLMDRIDAGKVHVHDISWLGLTDDMRTRKFCEGHIIDVVRKMPLASAGSAGAVKLRVCPRCGSVMEDIGASGGGMGGQQAWVWQSHKVCVCFSSWASPEAEEGK